jgi:hypothetical protein
MWNLGLLLAFLPSTPERAGLKNVPTGTRAGYHYLGAAKIMAPIGKALAKAMAAFHGEQKN